MNKFVNASAGSGKTFVLCSRYISLLLLGAKPSEILAITFTKKAALEMQERISKYIELIYKLINKNEKNDIMLDEIKKVLNEFGIKNTDELIHKNIKNVYFSFLNDFKRISTIDSFFSSFLRKFAFFSGIRNDFRITENENEVIYNFLLRLNKDEKELLLDLNIDLETNRINIKDTLNKLLNISMEFESQEDFKNKMLNNDVYLVNILKRYKLKEDISIQELLQELEKIKKLVASLIDKDILELDAKNAKKLVSKLKSQNVQNLFQETLWKQGKELRYLKKILSNPDQFHELCTKFLYLAYIYEKKIERKKLINLYRLLKNYELSLDFISLKTNQLSFSDIMRKTFLLMTNTNNDFSKDYFYFRLDSKINHILFDEYQDTSIIQYRIFKPLFDEILGDSGFRSLFFVGDAKQSIYSFRGSNVSIFKDTSKYINKYYLDKNFRSSKNILDFINNKFLDAYDKDYNIQHLGLKNTYGYMLIKIIDESNEELVKLLVEYIFKLLHNNIQKSDISILVDRKMDALVLIRFIDSNNINLKFNLDNNVNLLHQKHPQIIICALKINEILKNNQNFTNGHEKLILKKFNKLLGNSFEDDLIFKSNKKKLALIVKEIIETFRLFSDDALLCIELAIKFNNIDDFCEALDKTPSKNTSDFINIMTVHASKGLEFKHVIYFSPKSSKTYNDKSPFILQYEGQILKNIYFKKHNNFSNIVDHNFVCATENLQKARKIEELNRIYVACTRAKNSLGIFATNDSAVQTRLNLESKVIGVLEHEEDKIDQHRKIEIIKNLDIIKTQQEEFIKLDDLVIKNSLSIMQKKSFGQALHTFLELFLSSKSENTIDFIKSRYGFYLKPHNIKDISNKAQNFLIKQKLQNVNIKCEVGFLQDNKLKRIDGIYKNQDNYILFEFKSSQEFSEALFKKHENQTREYLKFIQKSEPNAKAFIVYFQDELKIIQIDT